MSQIHTISDGRDYQFPVLLCSKSAFAEVLPNGMNVAIVIKPVTKQYVFGKG